MLANLLPGLRDVRTPLAAGYTWLVALWVALEPRIPTSPDGDTVLGSFDRARKGLSITALGVAFSFTAYLIGTLSASLLSRPVRGLAFADALSRPARVALLHVARSGREQLVLTLALSNTDIDEFFSEQFGREQRGARSAGLKRRLRVPYLWNARVQRSGPLKLTANTPGVSVPRAADDVRWERWLAAAIARDLKVVATTRLLGRDQELYMVVDKNRAEADFRLGVVPPLLALAVAMAMRSHGIAAVALPTGILMSCALVVDAVRSERRANEILLDSIVDGRVPAPILDRAQKSAAAITGRTRQQQMARAAATLSVRLDALGSALDAAFRSEPAQAQHALSLLPQTRAALTQVRENFAGEPSEFAQAAVDLLAGIAEDWDRRMNGVGGENTVDVDQLKAAARSMVAKFRATAGRAVAEFGEAVGEAPHGTGAASVDPSTATGR